MTDAATDRLVLRHWPMKLGFAGVALLCLGSAVAAARQVLVMDGDRPELVLAAALASLALLALAVGASIKVRDRLILDDDGLTMVTGFRRHRLGWDEVDGWEVESGPRRWLVRAWCGERPVVVWRLMMLSGFGESTVTDETYPQPPLAAPGSVHRTFDELFAHWRAARDPD